MKYYRAKTPLPDYNIVLDSKYPAVVAEKGSGALKVFFPVEEADGSSAVHRHHRDGGRRVGQRGAADGDRHAEGRRPGAGRGAARMPPRAAFIQKYEGQGGKFAHRHRARAPTAWR